MDARGVALLKDYLLKEEKVIWTGQPETSIRFVGLDFFLVPFSIMWGGFAVFWEIMVIANIFLNPKLQFTPVLLVFPIFGIPFVLVGLYLIIGRFFFKSFRKKRTYYAVTNKRVLVLTDLWGKHLQAAYINTLPALNLSLRGDGTGKVSFENVSWTRSGYGNTGLELFSVFSNASLPVFYDIRDAKQVYGIVTEMRGKEA